MKPWEWSDAWKTEAEYFTWIRGQLRGLWSDNPVRISFKNESCRPVTPEERGNKVFHTSTKMVGQCVFCEEWFPKSKLQVDHKTPSDGCKTFEEAEQFLWYCAAVEAHEMQLACVPCHKIETYAERSGLSFEAARVEKLVIAFIKDSGKKLKHILTEEYNYREDQIGNDVKRRGAVRELISSGLIK